MSNFDVRILVNGNNCRQYNHNQKIFIEAKENSEYSIGIQNNTCRKILSLCSVDGLNILNGEQSLLDGPGYVLNGYSCNKFEGFRVSDDKVAKFVFGKKQDSYAKSKDNGSEQNVGVIGVKIYDELTNYTPLVIHQWYDPIEYSYSTPEITFNTQLSCFNTSTNTGGQYNCFIENKLSSEIKAQCCNQSINPSNDVFDMGTKWGEAKESKVVEVGFQKGNLAFSCDIYYASRQNLIDMGVPIGNEKQVSFPVSFPKYANPPKGWKS